MSNHYTAEIRCSPCEVGQLVSLFRVSEGPMATETWYEVYLPNRTAIRPFRRIHQHPIISTYLGAYRVMGVSNGRAVVMQNASENPA